MEKGNNVELLGPRRFGLTPVVDKLAPELTDELLLCVPKDIFHQSDVDVDTVLAWRAEITRQLEGVVKDVWNDQGVRFLVVCGDVIYASRKSFEKFDQIGFESTVPYLPTIMMRPLSELPAIPAVQSLPPTLPLVPSAAQVMLG